MLSLACTLLAGLQDDVRKELAVKARLLQSGLMGVVEGGEGGEGAVVGLSTLLFLLCHGRTSFRRSSTRRSRDFFPSGRPLVIAFSCQAEDNVRVWTELEAERRWTASFKERMDVESCCFICDLAGRP